MSKPSELSGWLWSHTYRRLNVRKPPHSSGSRLGGEGAAAGQVFRAMDKAGLSIETVCFDLAEVDVAWEHVTNARLVFRMERDG